MGLRARPARAGPASLGAEGSNPSPGRIVIGEVLDAPSFRITPCNRTRSATLLETGNNNPSPFFFVFLQTQDVPTGVG